MAVIGSLKHRGLHALYHKEDPKGIRSDQVDRVKRILNVLDSATSPQALDLPGYGLHPLKGKLKGFWAVKVGANWRIVFRFEEGNATDVDLVDYH